jgi:hypothetical protein
MQKKRPCSVCRRWFVPDPRVGARQRTCGAAECQRVRHRRADRKWHKQHPDYDRARRLLKKLEQARPPEHSSAPLRPPEHSSAPLRPPEHRSAPLRPPEHRSAPLRSPEHSSAPPRSPEQSSAPPQPPEQSGPPPHPKKPPLSGFPWDLAQDVMGPQATVIIAGVAGVLVHYVQDEIRSQVPEVTAKSGRHRGRGEQDEMEQGAPS